MGEDVADALTKNRLAFFNQFTGVVDFHIGVINREYLKYLKCAASGQRQLCYYESLDMDYWVRVRI